MSPIILLLLGFVLLFLGGELIVRGSVSLAFIMKISTLVVGMTVLAFATSAPELIVSLNATLDGLPSFAIGNVLGSNIANIGLVLAIITELGIIIILIQNKYSSFLRKFFQMQMSEIILYKLYVPV